MGPLAGIDCYLNLYTRILVIFPVTPFMLRFEPPRGFRGAHLAQSRALCVCEAEVWEPNGQDHWGDGLFQLRGQHPDETLCLTHLPRPTAREGVADLGPAGGRRCWFGSPRVWGPLEVQVCAATCCKLVPQAYI